MEHEIESGGDRTSDGEVLEDIRAGDGEHLEHMNLVGDGNGEDLGKEGNGSGNVDPVENDGNEMDGLL